MSDLFTWSIKMVNKRFEVTLLTPILFKEEKDYLKKEAKKFNLDIATTELERMLVIEGDEDTDIYKIIKFLAGTGFAMEVGLIKEITDYEPDIAEDELDITFIPE